MSTAVYSRQLSTRNKLFSVKHLEIMHIQQPKPSQGFKETNYDFLITTNLVHYYLCFYFLIENVI
jgi:hypothetical protein